METVAFGWPVVKGDCSAGNPDSCIAVITLASSLEPYDEAAMWGSCKTENLGAEKIIINTVSNSNIRYLLICGNESRGHLAGKTLVALHKNGIDDNGRIIGSDGAIPFIENVGRDVIDRFQKQVTLIERIGLVDLDEIRRIVDEYKGKEDPYYEAAFVVESAKKKCRPAMDITSGDIMISGDVMLDSSSGIVCEVDSN
ncbi:tetrahydromethanopterin S-methyltransferase subunit A [Methanococcoides sp. FTZ1]|uniref:tetrahydromethanopterin S-methyltransferase subunit A n=1 Tax=Methanococcoides sp. FTZ1 TaxID=3439061 RepID=UPI003F841B36